MPEPRPEQLTNGVSGWLVDPTWAEHHLVPKSTAEVLKTHHQRIGELAELRGMQLAVQKPAWTKALGEVPINPTNAARWYRVAAEVEAYRVKYRVPEHEAQPIPKDHYKQTSGLSPKGQHVAYLAGQVVDVHKRGALSNRPARSLPENQFTAQAADQKTRGDEQQTPAEQLIQKREQVRREHAARLLANRSPKTSQNNASPKDGASEAMEKIKQLQQDRREQQRQRQREQNSRRDAGRSGPRLGR